MTTSKRIAVLGGGLQGCCLALALAERGAAVTLFDRNPALMSRAATVNEGKIHLGYIYAGDPTLATARMMIRGAFSFAEFFRRYLGIEPSAIETSFPAVYAVHKDSAMSVDGVEAHLRAVSKIAREASAEAPGAYFGESPGRLPRRWSASELDQDFDAESVTAAFDTDEVAVQPVALGRLVRQGVEDRPQIEVRLRHVVDMVDLGGDRPSVRTVCGETSQTEEFDEVVNAMWDGQLALDAKIGLHPRRPWLHRFKYGVRLRLPKGFAPPPSATFVFGSFGELVTFADGTIFFMWYPAGMVAASTELAAPDWPTQAEGELRARILSRNYDCLSRLVVGLRGVPADCLAEAEVKGGVIVAWGDTDIDDPQSELHRRFELGLTSVGRYHSLDPGKYTLAPYFAELTASRIMPA